MSKPQPPLSQTDRYISWVDKLCDNTIEILPFPKFIKNIIHNLIILIALFPFVVLPLSVLIPIIASNSFETWVQQNSIPILIIIFVLIIYTLSDENVIRKAPKEADTNQFVEENLEQRMYRLTESLKSATQSINEIGKEIEAKVELANKLNVEIKAAELKTPEVEAVTQLLRKELIKERQNSLWQSMLIKFIFFLLGVGASVAMNMYFRKL